MHFLPRILSPDYNIQGVSKLCSTNYRIASGHQYEPRSPMNIDPIMLLLKVTQNNVSRI
jgi:hypothetical protein